MSKKGISWEMGVKWWEGCENSRKNRVKWEKVDNA